MIASVPGARSSNTPPRSPLFKGLEYAVLAFIGLALGSCTAAAQAPPLTVRTSSIWGYSILVPASWTFHNESYPSDHSTLVWSDPSDPAQKIQLVFSGCYGCSHNEGTGAPQPEVGGGVRVTSTDSISPTRLAYAALSSDDPYPDNGLVIVTKQGYTQIDCWLPQSAHHVATLILNSYQPVPIATAGQTPRLILGQVQHPATHSGGSVAAATVATGIGGVLILLIVLAVLFYFLPTIIALFRQHHQKGAVLAINLLLGWTLIGWAVSLAMAMSAKRAAPVIVNQIVGGSVPNTAPAVLPVGPPAMPTPTWPAGWYADPQAPGQMRRWDGAGWTGDVRPV